MKERRKPNRYKLVRQEVDALIEVMEQIGPIRKEPLKKFYVIKFSIGKIKYSIISQQQTRLPGMILSAISHTIEDRVG